MLSYEPSVDATKNMDAEVDLVALYRYWSQVNSILYLMIMSPL
jgi:hypothetical protein